MLHIAILSAIPKKNRDNAYREYLVTRRGRSIKFFLVTLRDRNALLSRYNALLRKNAIPFPTLPPIRITNNQCCWTPPTSVQHKWIKCRQTAVGDFFNNIINCVLYCSILLLYTFQIFSNNSRMSSRNFNWWYHRNCRGRIGCRVRSCWCYSLLLRARHSSALDTDQTSFYKSKSNRIIFLIIKFRVEQRLIATLSPTYGWQSY